MTQEFRPECAYGELQVRKGARVRHSVPARVDLETGAVHLEEYLSRDAYDFGHDDIVFRVRGGRETIAVDDGAEFEGVHEVDFCIPAAELPQIKQAWDAFQGTAEATAPRLRPR